MEDGVHARGAPDGGFLFVVNGTCPVETAAPSDQRGKKRPHHKSRRGCLSCKRRRVKCDERFPCSKCQKRGENCAYSATDRHSGNQLSAYTSQPTSHPVADDTRINLLHLELFHHSERDLLSTLAFTEIWQQVLPWSFQEPYIMSTILCLAATHLSILRPQVHRYHRAALQLLGRSAALFRAKLSNAMADQNIEALVATSILMNYISWSHVEFLEENNHVPSRHTGESLITQLLQDPLFQLSSAVRGVFSMAFSVLWGTGSVFLSASLYSPRMVIEETVLQHGDDPHRFVDYFMEIWDDQRYWRQQSEETGQAPEQTPTPRQHDGFGNYSGVKAGLNYVCPVSQSRKQSVPDKPASQGDDGDRGSGIEAEPASQQQITGSQRPAFERIARRLSLIFSLVSISTTSRHAPPSGLRLLQPDIERCIFTFPVLCGVVFRELALQNDPRVLVLLYHFYRAARILLTGPASWWATRRSRLIEEVILRDLTSRGLEVSILV